MNRSSPWALLISTGISLGMSMPLAKLASKHGVAPLSFVLIPALACGLLLAALAVHRHGWPSDLRALLGFGLVTGLLGQAVPNTLSAWLSARAGAGITGIAFTLPPVFTLALSVLLGLERAHGMRLLAVALGLAGGLWLAASSVSSGHVSGAGGAAMLAIPAVIGAGNVYRSRYLPHGAAGEWLGAAMSLGAFVWLLPVWMASSPEASSLSPAGVPYLLAQVAAGSLGVMLFFALQRRTDAVTMSFVGYMLALTAVLLGALVLGETLPWQLAPAAALIFSGFWLIRRHPAGTKPPPNPARA
jgi:drug/metabolite transporter (DMT)-like permease